MVMLRFDEPKNEVLPSDVDGDLEDLHAPQGATLPDVVNGIVGYAREFAAIDLTALAAQDQSEGDSLFTRTVSIQAILRWDIDDQAASGQRGVIICRGVGGSSSERVAYGLELRVVNAAARIGEVRFFWENLAGDLFTAVGGHFRMTRARETLMLTAVRRWSSQRDVVVRYYLGDQLLNEAIANDGEIGGGTSGTTSIGARGDGVTAPTAATLDTTTMAVPRNVGVWTAEVTWGTDGTVGNGKKLHLAIGAFAGDPGGALVEVRDDERWDVGGGAWVAEAGTVGVAADRDIGSDITTGDIETAINATSLLCEVTTIDPTAEDIIGDGEWEGTFTGGLDSAPDYDHHLDGAIDELRVLGRELVAEEIAATWQRIRVLQPAGEQLVRDCLPPGLPISDDPESRVQREIKWMGHALGYAAAQIENQRQNLFPGRAYGRALERWERITRQALRPGDDIDIRRRRVMGHFARRAGVSPPGVRAALKDLLACGGDQLELIAYSNQIRDDFATLRQRRWRRTPELAEWSVTGGELEAVVAAGVDAVPLTSSWRTCLTGVSGPERIGGYGAQIFAHLTPAFAGVGGAEAGLVLYDWTRADALLLGVRRDAGSGDTQVVSQRYLRGVAQPEVVHATTGNVPHWLHLYQVPLTYAGQTRSTLVPHGVRWSTTSASSGFTVGDPGDFAFAVGWCGFYVRSHGALGGEIAPRFSDAALWYPHGTRPFHFYVVRDPNIPGEYDLAGANASIAKLKQSHTHAAVITSRAFLAGNPESLCGRGPCGE
jgi:hypothetical protein